jgi:fructose-1,6-bisphosphatase/sedoheptulose 1,7-bisphosphatase-like protein
MLAEVFVILLTLLSIAVAVPQMTVAGGVLYSAAVCTLAAGHLLLRLIERQDAATDQKKRDRKHAQEIEKLQSLGADANSKLDLMSLKLDNLAVTKHIPKSDPQYQEVRQIAESVASSVTQMYTNWWGSEDLPQLQSKSVKSTGAQQP